MPHLALGTVAVGNDDNGHLACLGKGFRLQRFGTGGSGLFDYGPQGQCSTLGPWTLFMGSLRGPLKWEFPKIRGTLFGPHNKDYSILGSILGSPHFRKQPNEGPIIQPVD